LIKGAGKLGLATLVEAHDALDLERAIAAGAAIVGVNNRDLRTLDVDLTTSTRLIRLIPPGVIAVAESGVDSHEVLAGLHACGYNACLIGGHLMRSPDPGLALGALIHGLDKPPGPSRGDS
jgi:indole-3-glycerol phosphate synthase